MDTNSIGENRFGLDGMGFDTQLKALVPFENDLEPTYTNRIDVSVVTRPRVSL
jgi:hypothetical protein